MKSVRILIVSVFCFLAFATHPAMAQQSDQEIKQAIIEQSLASYPGNCPCPYNRDRAGRRCGKRSAYSKPGGYSPLCYDQDITPAMIEAYKKRNNR